MNFLRSGLEERRRDGGTQGQGYAPLGGRERFPARGGSPLRLSVEDGRERQRARRFSRASESRLPARAEGRAHRAQRALHRRGDAVSVPAQRIFLRGSGHDAGTSRVQRGGRSQGYLGQGEGIICFPHGQYFGPKGCW